MARTLGEYFEETRVKVSGGPDYFDPRRARMTQMTVDGRPLGDYEINISRDREGWKRFEEIQWLAVSLVGCEADLELAEIHTLSPRMGCATPGFEATHVNGHVVRIELFRLLDRAEKLYIKAINEMCAGAQALIAVPIPGRDMASA